MQRIMGNRRRYLTRPGADRTNDAAVAVLLIAKGADVMARDDRRQTPLDWAAAGNAKAVAALLVDRGET